MASDQFGDFQTPPALAQAVLARLGPLVWDRVLEPTCGTGAFLAAARSQLQAKEVLGIEIQSEYANVARHYAPVLDADIFALDLGQDLPWSNRDGSLLVVGNPPWVTNAQLGSLGSANLPAKSNIRKLSGLDAMTGASNFDIAEYIWLKLITELAASGPTIALLCKTSVARNVLALCAQFRLPITDASLFEIDAKAAFGVSVNACLFVLRVAQGSADYTCAWYESLADSAPVRRIGVVNGRLVADVDTYNETSEIDGISPVVWRQGIKHDAASVMELDVRDDRLRTKAGEVVDLEAEFVLPLLKSTDVFRGRTLRHTKRMIVPQRSLADSPEHLVRAAPSLFAYLERHGAVLDARKSSIYRSRPRFSVFGVGDYSFTPFKVAVSGLHKGAAFRAVGPHDGQPVVFDDTCYFTPVRSREEAVALCALLRSIPCQRAIQSLAFWDSKRPITKKLLQRLDLRQVARLVAPDELAQLGAEIAATDFGIKAYCRTAGAVADLAASWANSEIASPVQANDQGTLFSFRTSARPKQRAA